MGHARRSFLTSLVSGLVATANAKIRGARPARAPAAPEAAPPEGTITATTVAGTATAVEELLLAEIEALSDAEVETLIEEGTPAG